MQKEVNIISKLRLYMNFSSEFLPQACVNTIIALIIVYLSTKIHIVDIKSVDCVNKSVGNFK
jgi:hypothetical protein